MAMKPRTRPGRPSPQRNWAGSRPSSATDPRRRRGRPRPGDPSRRPETTPGPGPSLAPEGPSTIATLDAVLDDFTGGWERGECPRAERYLGLLRPEDSAELIYHEYCLAEASDLAPDPADYLRRFPEQAGPLGRLFALHGAFSASTLHDWVDPADLPSAGDEIGPYRLCRELGRGAFARVFLAEQADLDRRLVVLKVSTRSTAEPRLLARARHPHIVEVLRHAEANDGALHLVCMPFLGGATLASVLEGRRKPGRRPRSGLEFLADLDRASAPEYPPARLARPAREILAGLSYPKALAWVVARLAEALDHAHRRGVAHGDLKPSNVLLTAEGVPMLFDFNLSVDWRAAEAGDSTVDLGGTLAYMAPERLGAIAEGGCARPPKADDLHRADLYALGLLLLEALTGRAPEVPRTRTANARDLAGVLAELRRTLPAPLRGAGDRGIPPALRSILAHCLAPDPADRYARGHDLAEDLDRWVTDRPLAFADEPRSSTLTRRVRRRRSPLIALGLTLASAVAVASFASAMMTGSKRDDAESKYSMVDSRADSGAFGFRWNDEWRGDELGDPLEVATRQLARYGVLDDPDWRDRDDVRCLPDRKRGELEVFLFEQILRYSVALGENPDSPDDWKRALALLDRTLARVTSAPLEAQRMALRARLKVADPEAIPGDRPRLPVWMEEYLAGVAAEPLHARDALNHYLEALRDRPDLFWAHYRAAVVACRINEYELAARQLRECVARNPRNPALHLQLAQAFCHAESDRPPGQKLDFFVDPLEECERALALDPDYAPAYRVRAQIRQASGWVDGVQADVDRYATLTRRNGPAPGLALALPLNFRPGPNHPRPSEKIETLARNVLKDNPRDLTTRMLLAAVIDSDDRAVEAFEEYGRVLDVAPQHLLARLQRAQQLRQIDPPGAVAEFSKLIENPRFEEILPQQPAAIRAFHLVATDLMKRGQVAEALEVAQRSLVLVNRSRSLQNETIKALGQAGTNLRLSADGETYYLIARIHAAAVAQDRGRLVAVLDNLGRAFAIHEKFRDVWFANDPRFDGLRAGIDREMAPDGVDR